jgi:DNA repair exonuclease SbcCD ATPase subunit
LAILALPAEVMDSILTDLHSNRKRLRETESELILSRAHVSKLEAELEGLRREEKVRKIVDSHKSDDSTKDSVARVHKLEVERKELLLELKTTNDELLTVKCELSTKGNSLEEYEKSTKSRIRDLETQVIELEERALSAELERSFLRNQSQQLMEKHKIEVSCLNELCASHQKSIACLKERNSELESRVQGDTSCEAELEALKKTLVSTEDDTKLVNSMKDVLAKYSELESKNRRLEEENKILFATCGNSDLLKYKVACLEEKVKKADSLREELSKLQIENESLKGKLSKWEVSEDSLLPSSPLTMARRLAELQKCEILLRNSLGQKETELKVHQRQLSDADSKLREKTTQLELCRAEVKLRDEQIKRTERKLVFVTKERDGLANVLSSYKLDAGVDQQLKSLLVETEDSLQRSRERIQELEEQLALTEDTLNSRRTQTVEETSADKTKESRSRVVDKCRSPPATQRTTDSAN